MPKGIDRNEVQRLLSEGAQLVEVLPREEYEEEHLPGAKKAGWEVCVVVNEERIVFGLMRAKELAGDPDQTAEQAMRPGPSTFRPHVPIEEMASYMVEHDLPSSPITTSEGLLVGVLLREDAEREAHRLHEALHAHHTAEEKRGG